MSAVKPKKRKDNFQTELADALHKRREQGMGNGFTSTEEEEEEEEESDDDYESDFEEEEVPTPKANTAVKSKKSPAATKNDHFDFLQDSDDDDALGGGGSMFLKGSSQFTQQKEIFDPLGKTFRDSKQLKRQSGNAMDENSEEEEDPLLAFLRSSDEKAATTGGRHRPKTPEVLRSPGRRGHGVGVKDRGEFGGQHAERPKSPWEQKQSPRDDIAALFGAPTQGSSRSLGQSAQRSKSPGERQAKERPKAPTRRSQSPKTEKQTSALESILSSVKGTEPARTSTGSSQEKLKATDALKSQSIVDFLLDDSPKPVPRKRRTTKTSQDSHSQQDSLSRPSSAGSKMEKPSGRVLSPTAEQLRRSRSPSPRTGLSTKPGRMQSSVGSHPERRGTSRSPSPGTGLGTLDKVPASLSTSLTMGPNTGFPPRTQGQMSSTFPALSQSPRLHSTARTEHKQAESDANDLLALFDHAMTTEGQVVTPVQVHRQKSAEKSPAERVTEKTAEHKREKHQQQTSSHQLLDDVIESVAKHNEKLHEKPRDADSHTDEMPIATTTRPRSSRKSYRTPPANYEGLGSLAALKDLKTKGRETPSEPSTGAGDLRKAAYMEWLAKREKESKKKKMEELEKKKEEEEKKRKELEDKATENLIVRRKWEEVKTDEEKRKLRVKKAQERHKEKEQEQKEKEKTKNKKMAERRREEMLEAARVKKQEEMKKERKEQREKKKEEQLRKKDNKRAVESWMDKRSKTWVEDRKKEEKEKRKKNREEKYEKEKAAEEADERYKTWREQKDNQLKASMREKRMKERQSRYGDEEDVENMLPPWSPPNKVIPRQR